MAYYIKEEIQLKGIWKQDPGANFWVPKLVKMGVGKDSQRET